MECLELLFDKLTTLQLCLAPAVAPTEEWLRQQVLSACREVPECKVCLFSLAPTYEGVRSQLRSAISLAAPLAPQQFYTEED